MLRNFLTYSDLLKKEPELTNLRTTTEITNLLELAFEDFERDLRQKKGVNPKDVMIPVHLEDKSTTYSADCTGAEVSVYLPNQVRLIKTLKRFVVEKSACTLMGSTYVYLDGRLSEDTAWTQLSKITITSGSGIQTAIFEGVYDYYRYRVDVGSSLIMVADIFLVDNAFEQCIIDLGLWYVYESFIRGDNDTFVTKANRKKERYYEELMELSYGEDTDNDQVEDMIERKVNSFERGL